MSHFFIVIVTVGLILSLHLVIEIRLQKPNPKNNTKAQIQQFMNSALIEEPKTNNIDYDQMKNDLLSWVQSEKMFDENEKNTIEAWNDNDGFAML
jgi:hypothetical protein